MRTKAIILKTRAANEYDQLVSCYTEELGKVVAIAKSVLKPSSIQALHLDVFNMVDFELINGRSTPIITGAQSENSYPNIKGDLIRLSSAYLFAEIIDKLTFEYQKDEGLWGFLSSFLGELNMASDNPQEFITKKQVELLNVLGYAPNLNECTFCGKTNMAESIAYSTQARGIVCRDCFLNGQQGIVLKDGDWLSGTVLNSIFESLVEKKINSLNLVSCVIK